ncbi:MAG: TolC family protein [Phycisphaerales bacterium JB054]
MASRIAASAICAVAAGLLAGCSSPFDRPLDITQSHDRTLPRGVEQIPPSAFRKSSASTEVLEPSLAQDASPDDYVRYALYHSPEVEAAYQRWRASAERLPQVSALPDPRLSVGFFLEEVQTRTGPQEARVGVSQAFPWPGQLQNREDAASRAAAAAWRRFETVRLSVTERVVSTLHDLAYLDATISITEENLELLRSFEEVLRARYRVGSGSHPELIRIQVELGQLEDRLAQLRSMRPAYVAELNAALNRPSGEKVGRMNGLPGRIASVDVDSLTEIARRSNPMLLAMDEQIEAERFLSEVARRDGLPEFMVGLDYIVTGEAMNSSTPGSGDDPILLNFGISLPIWRDKYEAGVREALARRLAVAGERADQANRIAAGIHRAWFEHTDADRRVRLYENTLIPKAEESLRASLAGFRAGETSFLDLLDTERTLLEFAIAAERARADRGKALAQLNTLVGEPVPTDAADPSRHIDPSDEIQP